MTALAKTIARAAHATVGDTALWITDFGDGVVNADARGRDINPADVDAVRAAITGAGYTETDSWVATTGMSWLSGGIPSVSFRIRRAA